MRLCAIQKWLATPHKAWCVVGLVSKSHFIYTYLQYSLIQTLHTHAGTCMCLHIKHAQNFKNWHAHTMLYEILNFDMHMWTSEHIQHPRDARYELALDLLHYMCGYSSCRQ